jgi:hypothetical protein
MTDRLASLRAALAFLQLPVRAPELQILHGWLDTWTGVGMVIASIERHGFWGSLTHVGPMSGGQPSRRRRHPEALRRE